MSARKRKKNTSWALPPLLSQAIGLLVGPGRLLSMAILVTGVFVAGILAVWWRVGDDLLASDQYQVTAASLEITPLPDWIRSDPRPWIADYVRLKGPLSIMDDDATQRVADAFKLHPWVEHVVLVTKHHPATIRAELRYRRPVCLVFCVIRGKEELCPVDVRGIWLPADDFNPGDLADWPIVVGIESTPASLPGLPWRDECVVGAAEIAAAFGPSWRELGLHQIAPTGRVTSGSRAEYTYDLCTWRGARIPWGRPPGTGATDEPSAEHKTALLRRYVAAYGTLDAALVHGPIDLRRPTAPQPSDPVAAQ